MLLDMTSIVFKSALELGRKLRARKISSRELLGECLAQHAKHNPAINAVIFTEIERAQKAAAAADRRLKQGTARSAFDGVPMTIKESFDWAGTPSTWGDPALKNNIASKDAVALTRMTDAGAVLYGKTNVPLALSDWQSFNAIYGTTNNPWDVTRTPGGSSGGAAAALATGMSALEVGSDIGASIRNPAHYCGVFGHKPTWNLLPMRGHALGGQLTPTDISVIGPLTRSAEDLETQLRLLALPDQIEARGFKLDLPVLHETTQALRIAVWHDQAVCAVSAAVRDRVDAVAAALAGQGASVDAQARPDIGIAQSHALFQALLHSAMSARVPDDEFTQMLARADALAPDDQGPLAQVLRAQTLRARDWQRLNEQRTRLRWAWQRFFEQVDFVLTPVMATTAFAHDHRPFGERTISVDGASQPYFSQIFWAGLAGVAYLPATVIPAGQGPDGLPIGVQIIGPAYGDLRCVQLAQRLEALGFGFVPPPGL